VKEKVLAAHRIGIRTILLPKDNEKDLADIPPEVQSELEFKLVDSMDEVLSLALEKPFAPVHVGDEKFESKDDEVRKEGPVAH
jgi:ATP-dependent Lon protease